MSLPFNLPIHRDAAADEITPSPRVTTACQPPRGELPWLDIDRAFFIAVAHHAGDDTTIALDYRTSSSDLRVVASDAWTGSAPYAWRTVAETFSEFVAELRLDRADARPADG